ncbi:hypothetical protein [Membranihabitans maritimus]|uniref:hypothetical protein n=1 Tax=Membranihabitans maritimus TaxID=2904244 RepID=UPI001F35B915|nr:hypothetical protein [Membranihabitans maritimus]
MQPKFERDFSKSEAKTVVIAELKQGLLPKLPLKRLTIYLPLYNLIGSKMDIRPNENKKATSNNKIFPRGRKMTLFSSVSGHQFWVKIRENKNHPSRGKVHGMYVLLLVLDTLRYFFRQRSVHSFVLPP